MQGGAFRLFRFAGITVYLHFSWFIIAAWQLTERSHGYSSPAWAVYEYIALFAIVLLHEFGHALACRQTGGEADRIVLWPLGGIAFVNPPPRPGAVLWSIAAGPLVNVALIPIFGALVFFARQSAGVSPDLLRLLGMIRYVNYGLLIFNLLPIYPLDGGQIFRALLWFPLGQIRSLKIASVVGLLGGVALAVFALWFGSFCTDRFFPPQPGGERMAACESARARDWNRSPPERHGAVTKTVRAACANAQGCSGLELQVITCGMSRALSSARKPISSVAFATSLALSEGSLALAYSFSSSIHFGSEKNINRLGA